MVVIGITAAIVSIVARALRTTEAYQDMFREYEELVHVTVEVRRFVAPEGVPGDPQ